MWDTYLIVAKIGEGGVGSVYRVVQPPIMLDAALKVLTPDANESLADRFRGEATALARLNHPHIVRLLHFGDHRGEPFLVMEFVPGGRTLAQVARRGLTLDRVFDILGQLVDALEAAHLVGVVHRDVKPANIMLQSLPSRQDFLRLVDFGLAKFTDLGDSTRVAAGTPAYMAPEQLARRQIGPWTDWYAVGAIAFELLSGARPYGFASTVEVLRLKVAPDYCPTDQPHASTLPAETRRALAELLAHRPSARASNADAVRARLAEARDGMVGSHGPLHLCRWSWAPTPDEEADSTSTSTTAEPATSSQQLTAMSASTASASPTLIDSAVSTAVAHATLDLSSPTTCDEESTHTTPASMESLPSFVPRQAQIAAPIGTTRRGHLTRFLWTAVVAFVVVLGAARWVAPDDARSSVHPDTDGEVIGTASTPGGRSDVGSKADTRRVNVMDGGTLVGVRLEDGARPAEDVVAAATQDGEAAMPPQRGLGNDMVTRTRPQPETPCNALELGTRALAAAQLERAERSFQRGLDCSRRRGEALVGLAEVAFQREDRPSSLQRFQAALELEPRNADYRTRYGRVLYGLGKRAAACEAWRRALEEQPDLAVATTYVERYCTPEAKRSSAPPTRLR